MSDRRGHWLGADRARIPVIPRHCTVRDDAMTVTLAA